MARNLKNTVLQITYYMLKNIPDWENVNENSWPIIVYSPLRKTNQEKHNQTQGETHI
jgi:hypothetical protein